MYAKPTGATLPAAVAALAACVLLLPFPADAEFDNPITLSAGNQHGRHPQVAMTPAGDGLVVWQTQSLAGTVTIVGRNRLPNGTFGPVRRISRPGATPPRLAVNASGASLVIWEHDVGDLDRVQVNAGSAAFQFNPSNAQSISPARHNASSSQVAIDPNGAGLIVWALEDGRIQARHRSADGLFGPIKTVSARGQPGRFPQVAMDAAGRALIAWEVLVGDGPETIIRVRERAADGTYGRIRTLAEAAPQSLLHLGMSAAGDAVVVGPGGGVRARPAGGKWGPVEAFFPHNPSNPRIATSANGTMLAAWQAFVEGSFRVHVRSRTVDGTLSPVRIISRAGQTAFRPQVAINGDGDAVIAWLFQDGPDQRVQARSRSAAGNLGPVQTLSRAGADANALGGAWGVAIGAADDALVVWARPDADLMDRIQAANGP